MFIIQQKSLKNNLSKLSFNLRKDNKQSFDDCDKQSESSAVIILLTDMIIRAISLQCSD